MAGALEGLTIIELAAIGPVPFAGMMLADHGARVIRIERPGVFGSIRAPDALMRGREVVWLDLKRPDDVEALLELARDADALIEGNRPGVIERLGIGPATLLARNPRIVIGRMTGWGQDGPLASSAGHDINYTALSGALHTYGPRERPMAPTNTIGDYGGGGMLLAFGVLAGVLSARATGKGQEIDCAMLDGAALLSAMTYTLIGAGMWRDAREANSIDGGAWFYGTYETGDGRFVAVGPLEPQFRAILIRGLGLEGDLDFAGEPDPADWPRLREHVAAIFRTRTRAEWCALFDGTDACFAPVLSPFEAPGHPHNLARATFVEADGLLQPAPAPRFAATPPPPVRMTRRPG
jgi:alpha-methylacyl-CoA racemase